MSSVESRPRFLASPHLFLNWEIGATILLLAAAFVCAWPEVRGMATASQPAIFQCALLLQQTEIAAPVCGPLADKLRELDCDAIISTALSGIIAGQEVGRSLGKRHIFAEKEAIAAAARHRISAVRSLVSSK